MTAAMIDTAPSPFDLTGAQYAFDSTSLSWSETCPRLYQYMMIEGWQRLHGNVHLEFGGLYASALEHFHKHLALGDSRDVALDKVIEEVLIATWDYNNDRPKEWDHPSKTRSNLLRTIVWYCDQFDQDPLKTVILSDGKPAVEYSFRFELSDNILYSGHLDRLVEYNGDMFITDNKTTTMTVAPYYFEKFSPNTQMSGYAYAGNVVFHLPVKGVIIDAAQIAVHFSRFERGFTFRTPSQLEEWRVDTLKHIDTIRRHTHEGYYPQNRSSCDKFGGCAFRDVCARSPEVRPQFLRADFEQGRNWNPMISR